MRAKSAVALTRYPAKAERAEEYSLPCVKWLMLYVRSVLSTVSTAAAVRKDRMVPRACKGLPGIRKNMLQEEHLHSTDAVQSA